MKKMKKLLSMLLAVVMVLAMAAPSFADVAKTTIKVKGGKVGATYVAVKLLNSEEIPGVNGAASSYKYSVNEDYKDILQEITKKTNDGEIVSYIAALTSSDAQRTFADAVYDKVKNNLPNNTVTSAQSGEEVVATFENMDQGYYLVVETTTSDLADDSISLVMLNTAGLQICEILTKEDVPTVDKKVVENNEDKEAGDYAIGDTISYKLTGTLPNNLANYTTYFYQFTDTLPTQLDLVTDSVKVMVGTTDVTSNFRVVAETHSLVVTCNDVKGFVNANSEIVVTYDATLNNTAAAGAIGNRVKVEFSKDPYDTDKHGTTTETVVNVYTFTVSVDKVDVNNQPLSGAGFTLFKLDDAGDFVKVGTEIKDVTTFNFVGLSEGRYKLEETTVPAGFNKADDIYFTISATYGMKDGVKESEIKNLMVTVTDDEGTALTGNDVPVLTANMNDCTITTDVVNNTGTMLPSTGGIGTTIFYAAGIILMAGAVFFVVRRKRA